MAENNVFKPIMVQKEANLSNVDLIAGQYIVVLDTQRIYLDKLVSDNKVERVKASNENLYVQADAPTLPKEGDIWVEISE